jgi:N12 class adenine-specific DNA methylase
MATQEAPHTNGVMELTEEEILIIRERLEAIKEAFVPDFYTEYPDTFYLVSTYNKTYPDEVINGDTCSYVMSYRTEEEQEEISYEPPAE